MSGLDLNQLFAQWLDAQHEELTKKGAKTAFAYVKALDKVRAFPDPITTPKQLNGIQYVGAKLVKFLCAKLKKHCKENCVPVPEEFENYVGDTEGGKRSHELDTETAKKKKRCATWVPKRRGGSWAILVALYTRDRGRNGLRKEDVISAAEPYCDASFTANPAARDYYSAWNGINTLLKRSLVEEIGRPRAYVITEEGVRMASVLLQQEGLHSSPPRAAEASFDNGVRVSPESSVLQSSVADFSSPLKRVAVKTVDSPRVLDDDVSDVDESPGDTRPVAVPERGTMREKSFSVGTANVAATHTSTDRPHISRNTSHTHDAANRTFSGTHYDVWEPQEYDIVLLLDNREIRSATERDFFYKKIVGRNVLCDVRALSVGDVLWVARHKKTNREVVLNYICERKRIDDLAQSIRDGRFAEQKSRLKKSGIRNVHYIVEEGGLVDAPRVADMKQSLETSISMVITVSNFYLQRFKKADDTSDWLVAMTEVLRTTYSDQRLLVLKPRSVNTQEEYHSLLQQFRQKFENRKTAYQCVHTYALFSALMVKTNMMTVKEMFLKMLMSVRGISFDRAILLQRHFVTPRGLIEFYIENYDKSEQEKGLLILNMFSAEVGPRKINKAASVAMYEAWGKPVC